MHRFLSFLTVLFVVSGANPVVHAASAQKPANSFTLAPAKDGKYAPWRDPEKAIDYYASEITTIDGAKFRYTYSTDVIAEEEIPSDFSGTVNHFDDHVYLDHPGVPFPYRVTGFLDGVFVMTTWTGYEHWKKFGTMPEYGLLFLQQK